MELNESEGFDMKAWRQPCYHVRNRSFDSLPRDMIRESLSDSGRDYL